MSHPFRPASFQDTKDVREMESLLERARDIAKRLGCVNTLERIRSAISSAKGAVRAVDGRRCRTNSGFVRVFGAAPAAGAPYKALAYASAKVTQELSLARDALLGKPSKSAKAKAKRKAAR